MSETFDRLDLSFSRKTSAKVRILGKKNKIFQKKSYLCTLKIDEYTNLFVKMQQ